MRAGSRFVIDSSAWIEYLENLPGGKKAAQILEGEGNIIITPRIVMAEICSKTIRSGGNPEQAREIIESFSAPVDEDSETYFEAVRIHAELRKKFKNASLADAIVISVSRRSNAKLVTKDFHMKGENTVYIG